MPGMHGFHDREKRQREEAELNAAVERAAADRAAANNTQRELWAQRVLMIAGFSETAADILIAWRADARQCANYVAQGATHEQVMRITRPLLIPASREGS